MSPIDPVAVKEAITAAYPIKTDADRAFLATALALTDDALASFNAKLWHEGPVSARDIGVARLHFIASFVAGGYVSILADRLKLVYMSFVLYPRIIRLSYRSGAYLTRLGSFLGSAVAHLDVLAGFEAKEAIAEVEEKILSGLRPELMAAHREGTLTFERLFAEQPDFLITCP